MTPGGEPLRVTHSRVQPYGGGAAGVGMGGGGDVKSVELSGAGSERCGRRGRRGTELGRAARLVGDALEGSGLGGVAARTNPGRRAAEFVGDALAAGRGLCGVGGPCNL